MQLFLVVVDRGSEQAAIDALLQQAHCTVPVCVADAHRAGAWNLQYRCLFDRRLPLQAPASFLLDRDGAVVRVYREQVRCSTIAEDALSMPANAAERLARALPFAGPYHGAPMRHDYLSFGIAFSESGYVDEAQAAFQRAIADSPGLQVECPNLGTLFLNRKLYIDARRCLLQAVQLNPRDSDAWNNLGSLSGTEKKHDEALEEFRQAVLANPQHANALENMMHICQFQARAADAQTILEQFIVASADTASLHLALSLTLVAQNDLLRARKELETAVRLDPTNADALNNLGAVLLHMGLAPEALQRFEECRRLAPDFNRATINVALLYHRNGQDGKAQ